MTQKIFIDWYHLPGLRPTQHHLGDEQSIWVNGSPPWERSSMAHAPCQKLFPKEPALLARVVH
jgi:hypothetical protein